MDAVAIILGSAFSAGEIPFPVRALTVETPWGTAELHRVETVARPAYAIFRHGRPYRYLPHQIPYRAHAWAAAELGCRSLLVTSSVGVLDTAVPLFQPLLVGDILTLDNRLPDGSACTLFDRERPEQGHLVLSEGLISRTLQGYVAELCAGAGSPHAAEVVFGYSGGPRTKTPAENRMWRTLGAQVNSMTVAPEIILAGERGIACAALVVGHKRSLGGGELLADRQQVADSLAGTRALLSRVIAAFAECAPAASSANFLYKYETL